MGELVVMGELGGMGGVWVNGGGLGGMGGVRGNGGS